MKQKSAHATLEDVARLAGVSLATASRVIRNSGPTSPETRSHVLAAADSLGYQKKGGDQAASRPPTRLVALMISDILNPFFPELVRGVEEESMPNGYGLLLHDTSEDPGVELLLLDQVTNWNVSGIIFCSSRVGNPALMSLYERAHIPMVVINRRVDHPAIPSVMVDFQRAAYRAALHLISLKHKRIAYLGGMVASETSQHRFVGIQTAMNEAGLEMQPAWCNSSFPSVEGGFQGMSSLLASNGDRPPTAVIAYNDLIAIGAMNAIRAHGLRVPDDISVIGFDGIHIAAYTDPPLTTINQPKHQMGQLAMRMLHTMMSGQTIPGGGYTLMESPLIIRGSTGIAPY